MLIIWIALRNSSLPRVVEARWSASSTQAAYILSVVVPPPKWPGLPATVRMSTPPAMRLEAEFVEGGGDAEFGDHAAGSGG
ncbi:hypothetical protein [Actinosynnema sp. NPDC020468]|uniref:hypothetical protein n=1 Tax=Actinosynnema sp. NPDC020468 TaxID=3154488 RepID=UPI0033C64478